MLRGISPPNATKHGFRCDEPISSCLCQKLQPTTMTDEVDHLTAKEACIEVFKRAGSKQLKKGEILLDLSLHFNFPSKNLHLDSVSFALEQEPCFDKIVKNNTTLYRLEPTLIDEEYTPERIPEAVTPIRVRKKKIPRSEPPKQVEIEPIPEPLTPSPTKSDTTPIRSRKTSKKSQLNRNGKKKKINYPDTRVERACKNCHHARKKCEPNRPCERCVTLGLVCDKEKSLTVSTSTPQKKIVPKKIEKPKPVEKKNPLENLFTDDDYYTLKIIALGENADVD